MYRRSLFKAVYLVFMFFFIFLGSCTVKKHPKHYSAIAFTDSTKEILHSNYSPIIYQKRIKKSKKFNLIVESPVRKYEVDLSRLGKMKNPITLNDTICIGNLAYFNQGCFILNEIKIDKNKRDTTLIFNVFKYHSALESEKYNNLNRKWGIILNDDFSTIKQIAITKKGFIEMIEIIEHDFILRYNWNL